MSQKLSIILFVFAFIVAIVVGFGGREEPRPAPAEFRAKFHETLLKPKHKIEPTRIGNPVERNPSSERIENPSSKTGASLNRNEFLFKYGERLKLTDYEDRVIRVDGSGLPSEAYESDQKLPHFRPSSPIDVMDRAREIFSQVRGILGVSEDDEFILHPPTTGESTAQVVIQQSENGVPISPGGLVTMLLGPDGEVRSIESSVYPVVEVVNAATLPKPESAREILYVTQSSPKAVARHAYETRERGLQKVVDAETGVVLLERNRRIY